MSEEQFGHHSIPAPAPELRTFPFPRRGDRHGRRYPVALRHRRPAALVLGLRAIVRPWRCPVCGQRGSSQHRASDRPAWHRRVRTPLELAAAFLTTRRAAERLPDPSRRVGRGSGRGRNAAVGFRQAGLRGIVVAALRRSGPALGPALLVAGAGLGRAGPGLGLERPGVVGDGPPQPGGLDRALDRAGPGCARSSACTAGCAARAPTSPATACTSCTSTAGAWAKTC